MHIPTRLGRAWEKPWTKSLRSVHNEQWTNKIPGIVRGALKGDVVTRSSYYILSKRPISIFSFNFQWSIFFEIIVIESKPQCHLRTHLSKWEISISKETLAQKSSGCCWNVSCIIRKETNDENLIVQFDSRYSIQRLRGYTSYSSI